MEGFEELLDGLLLGPEIAVKNGNVRDRASALLREELLDRRMPGSGILDGPGPLAFGRFTMMAIQLGHGYTSSFRA
jgi:hypothetical protein